MTDFLHPQGLDASSEPTKDALNSGNEASVAPSQGSGSEVASFQVPETNTNPPQAVLSEPSDRITPPIRRNFAAVNRREEVVSGSEQEEGDEAVRHVLRKESPLFVHYYQSIFLLLITLFVMSGYFVLNPLIIEFKRTNQLIQNKVQEKEDANAFLSSVNRSIEAAQSISPETLAKINEALPKEVEIPILLKLFGQLADQNGVTMGGIQFSPQGVSSDSPTYGGYALVPVQISLSIQAPGYQIMRKYLEDLQTNVQLMDVKSISVSGDESTGAFAYTLELTTYYIQKSAGSVSGSAVVPTGAGAIPPTAPNVGVNDI